MSRNRNPKRRKFCVRVMLVGIAAILLYTGAVLLLAPAAMELAKATAGNSVQRAVREAVREAEPGGETVRLEKDGEGKITALRTDTGLLNDMGGLVAERLLDTLGEKNSLPVRVPLGPLLGLGHLFRGRGIRVRLLAPKVVECRFESGLQSAGINQTEHRLTCTGAVEYTFMFLGYRRKCIVPYSVPAADTLIVGEVPDSYTFFSGVESAEDAANDYLNFN